MSKVSLCRCNSDTRQYNLHITNVTNWMGPDGVVKHAMLINSWSPEPILPCQS